MSSGKFLSFLVLGITFVLSQACQKQTTQATDNGESSLVAPQAALEGKMDSKVWMYKAGVVREATAEVGSYSITLYESGDSAPDICKYFPPLSESTISFTIQKSIGTKPLGANKAVSFNIGQGKNLKYLSRDGAIWVDSITGVSVQGSLTANYDAFTNANGSFSATICP